MPLYGICGPCNVGILPFMEKSTPYCYKKAETKGLESSEDASCCINVN